MNELYHHGILGQKWGIRRYQNEDEDIDGLVNLYGNLYVDTFHQHTRGYGSGR